MAKFSLSKPVRMVIRGAGQSVIPNPQGMPTVVNTQGKQVNIPAGVYETNDQEIIDRIRADMFFNTPRGIIEISEEEQEAIKIRQKKHQEAEEEIKEVKKRKQK